MRGDKALGRGRTARGFFTFLPRQMRADDEPKYGSDLSHFSPPLAMQRRVTAAGGSAIRRSRSRI
jgi:hypothetical protein